MLRSNRFQRRMNMILQKQTKKGAVSCETAPRGFSGVSYLESLLSDTCFLTSQFAEVEDTSPSHATVLVNFNLVNKRRS